MSKFVYLNKSLSDDMRFESTGRVHKFISVKDILQWINDTRLNVNPLPMDKQSIAQNEVYKQLIAYITAEELE